MQGAAGKHHHEDNRRAFDQSFGNGKKQRLGIDMMLVNSVVAPGHREGDAVADFGGILPSGNNPGADPGQNQHTEKQNVRILQTKALFGGSG